MTSSTKPDGESINQRFIVFCSINCWISYSLTLMAHDINIANIS